MLKDEYAYKISQILTGAYVVIYLYFINYWLHQMIPIVFGFHPTNVSYFGARF